MNVIEMEEGFRKLGGKTPENAIRLTLKKYSKYGRKRIWRGAAVERPDSANCPCCEVYSTKDRRGRVMSCGACPLAQSKYTNQTDCARPACRPGSAWDLVLIGLRAQDNASCSIEFKRGCDAICIALRAALKDLNHAERKKLKSGGVKQS